MRRDGGWIARHPAATFVALNVLPTALFLLLAKALAWTPEVARGLQLPLVFTPVASAYWLTHRLYGESGVQELTARIGLARVGVRWWVVALGGFAMLAALALGLRYLHDGVAPAGMRADLATAPFLMLFLFLFPGLTEEPGWRGFLQPHLQERHGALFSSVAVGLTWSAWHARSIATDPERYGGSAFLWFVAYTVAVAVILGWLLNQTRGSVLLAMVGHFGANLVNFFAPMNAAPAELNWKLFFGVLGVAAVVLVLVFGPRTLTRDGSTVRPATGRSRPSA